MTFKIERTFKDVGIVKKDSQPSLVHLVDKYHGETMGFRELRTKDVVNSFTWNTQLPVPMRGSEIVYVHPDQTDIPSGYVRVIHSEHKAV